MATAREGQGYGVDIGGSGIKGAPVDLATGELAAERHRIATPQPATPDAVAAVVRDVVAHHGWTGPIGSTLPAVVQGGVARTAANIDRAWIGTDAAALLTAAVDAPVTVLNDADAAGVAEMAYGAGREETGTVVIATFGTGIGTSVFVGGQLVPNTELGHLELDGYDAETRAADRAREQEDLSWSQWAGRVNRYLHHLEDLLWPDLIVVGGGVSKPKKAPRWIPELDVRTRVVTASLHNEAGIVGAALVAAGGWPPG